MCVFLAKALHEKGFKPAIISRGYGRKPVKSHPEPLFVSKGHGPLAPVEESGDEPFLMAIKTNSMVVLAKKRSLAAKQAIEAGADILVLDDGFQHLALKRDLDILMVQANQDFEDDLVVPAGYLRETAKAQLRADIIVAIGGSLNESLLKVANGRPVFLAKMVPTGLTSLASGAAVDPASLKGQRLGAFCGLARPSSFFRSVSDANIKLNAHLCFPDHVAYGQGDLSRLTDFRDLNQLDCLLTTAKDAVKLPKSLPFQIVTMESELELERPREFLEETLSRLS
jgi:tetraacyldisaccharide 4'-kinase